MADFKKNDLFLALAIGLVSAWMLVFVVTNLSEENKFFEAVLPYANYLFLIFPLLCGGGLLSLILWPRLPTTFFINWGNSFWSGGFNFYLTPPSLIFFFATNLTTGWPQSGFKGVSFVLGIVSSYLLNKRGPFRPVQKKDAKKRNYSFCFYKPHRFFAEYRPGLCFREYGRQFLEYEADSLGAIFRRDGGGNNYVLEFPRLQIHRL